MFDFRYHVASLAAVFFALVIGILVGVALASHGLGNTERSRLEEDLRRAESQSESLNTTVDALTKRGKAEHAFVEATYKNVMANRLKGKKIALLFGSANRDPRVFERPDEFDVGRENAAQHIGFGGGIHVCIGAPLARVELEASVDAIARFWPDFELSSEPRRTGAFVIWGLQGLQLARA